MASNYPGPSQARVSGLLAGTIVPTVLSSCFVIARIYSRRFVSGKWRVDDTLIAISWVTSLGLAVISCLFVEFGAGRHQKPGGIADLEATMKLEFANRIVYQFVLGTTKLGICSFYLRIFQTGWSRRFIYALLIYIAVAAITMEFTMIFSCRPVSGVWALGAAKCPPPQSSYIGNTVVNILGDLAIMAFVIPQISCLQLPRRQKIYVSSIVSSGLLVIIASIFRLLSTLQYDNSNIFSWEEVNITTWLSIEVSTGFFCASAPCIQPLVRKFFPALTSSLSDGGAKSPNSGDIKTIRSRRQSMQSHKSAFIPHLKKALFKNARIGLEEVKLKTIKAKRHSRGTFAYAIRKRDDVYQEGDLEDLRGGASVETWLGKIDDEEAVKKAAATLVLSDEDGGRDFATIGKRISGVSSVATSG